MTERRYVYRGGSAGEKCRSAEEESRENIRRQAQEALGEREMAERAENERGGLSAEEESRRNIRKEAREAILKLDEKKIAAGKSCRVHTQKV